MLAVKQQQSADAEFDGHGDPHAAQAERGDEKHRETEADDPDAAKVQKARHKRIARSTEGSGGNDGSAEKRLGHADCPARLHCDCGQFVRRHR